jgi:formate dehydrogenase beta subunit
MLDGEYKVEINPENCKECGYCMEICSLNVFAKSDHVNANGFRAMAVVKSEDCDGCEKCLMICPDFAITITEL